MLLLFGLLVAVAVLVLIKHLMDMRRFKNFPPGPQRLPLLGSLLSMPGELIHLHAERHWRRRFGPLVGLTTGSQGLLMVCGAEEVLALLAHEHTQTRPPDFSRRDRSFGKPLGIMFSDGPYWTEQRRFALRELRDLGLGKTKLEGVVLDELDAVADALRRDGPVIQATGLFNSSVLNVLWWMVSGKPFARGVGSTLDPRAQRLLDIMNHVMRNKKMGTAPCDIWPFLKYVAPEWSSYNDIYPPLFKMHSYLRDEIKLQRQSGDTGSFIGKYSEEISKASPGSGFNEESLIVTCLDLFMAGGESTANTLSFALLYMGMHPEVQAKVRAELDSVCGGPSQVVTMADKARLPFTEATLTEVMRINTIAPLAVPHNATEAFEMNGYDIPKGTLLFLSMWSVLHDKKHWGDPEEFRPERFLDASGKFVKDPYMVPFGSGKRLCIGEGFAMQVAFLFFANLINRFKFSFPAGAPSPSTIPEAGFTVAPQPFSVLAEPRA